MSENSPSFHDTGTVTEVPVGTPGGSAPNVNDASLETQGPENTPFVPPETPTPRRIPAIPTGYPAIEQTSLEVVPDSYYENAPPRQQLSYDDTAADGDGDQNSAGRYWEPPPDRRGTLNSDPDAVCMYYERRRQNTGPPPFGRGRVNSNTEGAASGPRSRPIPRGFEQWRSSINMPVN